MTDDITNTRPDEQPIEKTETTRRQVLQKTALLPTVGVLAPSTDIRSDDDTGQFEGLLVDDSIVPTDFNHYPVDEPAPFARTLMTADDRFVEDDFDVAGFTEGPDPSNPRYVVTTMRVTLPEPDTLETVRTHLVTEFEDFIDSYAMNPRTEWTHQSTDAHHARMVRLNGRIKTDSTGVVDIDWLASEPTHQFGEHWGLDAVDDYAVLTVVFGYRGGPWQPRTLFERVTSTIRHRLLEYYTGGDR